MKQVVLKPELRTLGGETVSLYLGDEWAGDLYLVYREGDVLTGTIQIDTGVVSEEEMEVVATEVRTYIEHLNVALGVEDSSVVLVYGDISSMVEMEPFEVVSVETVQDEEFQEHVEYAVDDVRDDERDFFEIGDVGLTSNLEFVDEEDDTYDTDEEEEGEFHLSVAYRHGEHTKYHLHDDEHHTLGVVSVDEIGNNVSGRVEFWKRPDDEEANEIAKMLVRTFGEYGEAEHISFTMNHADLHIGDMHVERRDFL